MHIAILQTALIAVLCAVEIYRYASCFQCVQLNSFVFLSDKNDGWLRSLAVERRSLAGKLSLSCARPVADR